MERKAIQQKAVLVQELQEKLEKAVTVVTFDYQGLTVSEFTQLRSKLREAGSEVTVYKNNITRRASIAAGYEALSDTFVGAKAIALSYEDVVAPAKIVFDFAKDNKKIVLHGGVIEGKIVGVEAINELALLPSRETMLTRLAVGLLQPVRELAIGLNMISEENN